MEKRCTRKQIDQMLHNLLAVLSQEHVDTSTGYFQWHGEEQSWYYYTYQHDRQYYIASSPTLVTYEEEYEGVHKEFHFAEEQ